MPIDNNINNRNIDLSEDEILSWGQGILQTLLIDRTTGHNIYWATDDYVSKGEGYSFYDEITVEKITGKNARTIQPRILKTSKNQRNRSRNMAEVFTPSWICNAQNNLIDEAWFGRKDVFNRVEYTINSHTWIPTEGKIAPFPEGKTWKDYVTANRMEIACGEAPYLCSRFDATTGEFFSDLNMRIGLFDRKLRLVSENANEEVSDKTAGWRRWAMKGCQATYGFEFQGDNLLLAREAMLWSYREYYKDRWGRYPIAPALKKIAEIISWNLWQMDGITYGLPGYEPKEDVEFPDENLLPEYRFCRVMEWTANYTPTGKPIIFKNIIKR